MSAYDAVCFDLDSTLCEPIEGRAQLLEATFERAGIEQFCTVGGLRVAAREVNDAETDREFFEALFTEAARNADVDPAVAPDLADAYLATIDPARVRFRAGAEAALERAREDGPIALITNGTRETQIQKLETLGITDAFDTSVFVDPRKGIPPKPHAKPFELALSGLDVEPEATVHVGDNLYADVAGANAMGMDSAWITLGYENTSEHEPTYELSSLEEFHVVV